jgi:lactate racemase
VNTFSLPYGDTQLTVTLPAAFRGDSLMPDPPQPMSDPENAIRAALANPLGGPNLETFNENATVGIAINDKTRPIPYPNPILPLLEHLAKLGFADENISIFISSGTHTPMASTELPSILSEEIIQRYTVLVHDCDLSPTVSLGKTAYQTPTKINADFYQCDLKISVGNIEPHHFMGFSGGVKTAVIGLASRETINNNHIMLTHPQSKSGIFLINPMRQDVEEMGRKAGVQLSLGTILDEHKNILKVFFGEPDDVMQAAIPVVRKIFGLRVPEPYDLVIASPGGAPKDINLYQAQKALTHAAQITRDGGWVILLAACPEGSGSQSYESYVTEAKSHQAIINQFQDGFFEVGPHKAYLIARAAQRVNIILVSEINPADVKRWKLTPSQPGLLEPLIEWVTSNLPQDARIAILPAASRTMTEVLDDTQSIH